MKNDALPIEGIDYVELYVGNAKQASYFYKNGFGFSPVAYSGPETGVKDKTSYLMQQGDIRLLLTSSLIPDHPISRYVITHGDGVADVAMRVKDVDWTYKEAVRRGAKGIQAPKILKDDHGTIRGAAIAAYGDTVHTFIERHDYRGIFAPGYVPFQGKEESVGLKHVDHVVANVEEGKMDYWVEFLRTPDSYYTEPPKRVGGISERIDDLKRLGILVDKDEKGYMLDIFTNPLQDRPTLFFELIQRKGSESFGKGNFKALFQSIEAEQAKRGNL